MDDGLTLRLSPIVVARMSESEMRVDSCRGKNPDFAALIRGYDAVPPSAAQML